MWKLKDGSGYFVLHKREKKGSNILVVTDKGLSNQASRKLIFYSKGLKKILRSWDLRLPENINMYLSEDSGQLFFYPNVESPLKDIHIFELNEKYALKKLGVLKMNGNKREETPAKNINPRANKRRTRASSASRKKVDKRNKNTIQYIFHRENIFLLNPVKYEILAYSSKMVFKYRINIAGVSPMDTLLEIYPLGAQTMLIHEYSVGNVSPVSFKFLIFQVFYIYNFQFKEIRRIEGYSDIVYHNKTDGKENLFLISKGDSSHFQILNTTLVRDWLKSKRKN